MRKEYSNSQEDQFCRAEGRVCAHANDPKAPCQNVVRRVRVRQTRALLEKYYAAASRAGASAEKLVDYKRRIEVLKGGTVMLTVQDYAVAIGKCPLAEVEGEKGVMYEDRFEKRGIIRRFFLHHIKP